MVQIVHKCFKFLKTLSQLCHCINDNIILNAMTFCQQLLWHALLVINLSTDKYIDTEL